MPVSRNKPQTKKFLCSWLYSRTTTLLKIPYSGLFSWVQIFLESWRWPSEIIFVVLNFVVTSECARMGSQIL